MNKEMYRLLQSFDLLDEEIEQCFSICPGLDIVDLDKASACIETLIKNGYPKEDVGLLLAVNPGILMYESAELAKKLKSFDGDIEEILKDDPFAI